MIYIYILLWPWNTHLLYIHLPIVCHCEWSQHKSTIIAFMVHLFSGPYIYIHIHTWILYIYIIVYIYYSIYIIVYIYIYYCPFTYCTYPPCLTFKSPCGWHPTFQNRPWGEHLPNRKQLDRRDDSAWPWRWEAMMMDDDYG